MICQNENKLILDIYFFLKATFPVINLVTSEFLGMACCSSFQRYQYKREKPRFLKTGLWLVGVKVLYV